MHYHVQVVGINPGNGRRESWRGALCTTEDGARTEAQIEVECGKGDRKADYAACNDDCFGRSAKV